MRVANLTTYIGILVAGPAVAASPRRCTGVREKEGKNAHAAPRL